jgi:hypothetical protein
MKIIMPPRNIWNKLYENQNLNDLQKFIFATHLISFIDKRKECDDLIQNTSIIFKPLPILLLEGYIFLITVDSCQYVQYFFWV